MSHETKQYTFFNSIQPLYDRYEKTRKKIRNETTLEYTIRTPLDKLNVKKLL